MRARILAVLAAVALVALAVFVRGKLVDAGNGGGDSKKDRPKPVAERPVVACTPDLAAICAALADAHQIATGTAPLDLDGAADPPKEIQGWITWSPAPEVADLDTNGERVWKRGVTLGSAELGVFADPATLGCGPPVEWNCLADKAGPDLPIGVGLVTTADGLARLAPLAPSLARDGDPTAVDVGRGRAILDGPASQDDAPSMFTRAITQPGAVAAVVAPLPAATRAAATPQARDRNLQALPARRSGRVAVVLASRVGRNVDLVDVVKATRSAVPAERLTSLGLSPGGASPTIDPGALWQLREQLR